MNQNTASKKVIDSDIEVNLIEPDKKYSIIDYLKNLGPGAIVSATIIGPGTITACTLAGVNFQYILVWTILFSVIATLVLQNISSRIGIATGKGLAELIHDIYKDSYLRFFFAAAVILAIGVGNSAFQSGNMSGAVLGLKAIVDMPTWIWATVIVSIASIVLWTGRSAFIEKIMLVLIVFMVIIFVLTAIAVKPDFRMLFSGFAPTIPKGSILVAIGMVGTTVVPHLLFMHSSLCAKRYEGRNKNNAIKESMFDTNLNLFFVGIISLCVVITGAALFGKGIKVSSGLDMAKQLEPLLGSWAKYVFGAGLFAAGISSAFSAPMSAAYAICGILRWPTNLKDKKFRIIWIVVMLIGYAITASGIQPITVILLAQSFNGVMLPLSAAILMLGANNKSMGKFKNTHLWNIAGALTIAVTIILAYRTLSTSLPQLLAI
ncbi:Nramp family divalent metal transporter [Youngiibacter multivorans]|uniref:NRAMP (Natural resistance-associated macrophage protein)-like metal ion transporter n=1 Tax=Youngiibacter multivorans TaxID=937251 RepID=A0ABS4G7A6_9CLOT|nr:Nramp family divalent metal transporter [Youngiibacter multivorans]MBP1920423.1 NRAMP (natural resistance-associated macrophage protein)-like metal ion transporter [Youngiibacter multivorans]